jgi:hypothetical protein
MQAKAISMRGTERKNIEEKEYDSEFGGLEFRVQYI